MTKHSHSPYTSTYNSTPHNTNRKHNINHIPYTNTQHTSTLQGSKPTIFNNGRYTKNIPTDPHTVTTADIKTNMRHIHTSIVSMHLATRGNNKILRTPPPHTISSEERLPRPTRRTLAQLRTNKSPFLNSYLHKVDAITHPSPLCPPSVTSTHTTHIISSTAPTYAPHYHPGFVDRHRRSDCTAGQMDGEAGWWTTSGNIGLPPLARVMGVGRQQHNSTVCVAVDLTAAFDTVNHNVLLSKIVRTTLPEATCRWLSNNLRCRQSVTSCRGDKSKARIVHTGVWQGSKMSPTLFSFYLADMPRPTEPVKRICYADDITVCASGVKIPELKHKIIGYLTEMSCFLRDNLLLISTPKSTVTMFTSDTMQANTHPKIEISDAELPLVRKPKLPGVYLDTFFSFNVHCVQVANRVNKINNVLKAHWGQQRETLLLTYKALGRSMDNYAEPVWKTDASYTSLEKIQRTENEALRIITGSHKMSSIDHLHSETKILLVKDHLNLLAVQYLVHWLDTDNVYLHITTMDHLLREMKETLFKLWYRCNPTRRKHHSRQYTPHLSIQQ